MTTHGVAASTSAASTREQVPDVLEVQARRRLVEHVERAAGLDLAELARELHALRLAAASVGAVWPIFM